VLTCGHIFLTGFSGSGKSTVGHLLAARLKRRFVDTDRLVERRAKRTIPNIFHLYGQTHFRDLERQVIADLAARRTPPLVVALGGGTLMNEANRCVVRSAGCIVYLSCSLREIYRRTRTMSDRPLLAPQFGLRQTQLMSISKLLAQRLPGYQAAGIKCSTTSRTPLQAANVIAAKLTRLYGDH
jgi:shikimate kinase